MENLTLVIPAKFEATTLPIVLREIKDLNLNCKKIIVVPKYDEETQKALEGTDCEVLIQKGEGFGNALIEGLNHSSTEYSCIFNADGSFDPKYLNEMLKKTNYDDLNNFEKIHLYYGVHKAYEDIKDFKNAFKFLKKGNELLKIETKYDFSDDEKKIQGNIDLYKKIKRIGEKK